jgi:glycosyltransferase involved in cell wall biosynthesis
MISQCINSCKIVADEIVVIDNGSNDKTIEIAQQKGAKIEISNHPSFAVRRDLGLQKSSGDWVLYVDADERVTPELAKEIKSIVNSAESHSAYIINRKDFYLGAERPLFSPMHRFFKRSDLKNWHGDLHETPNFEGTLGTMHNYFLHFTHINLNSMLENTILWSDREATLRFNANHPPVVWWRLIRVFLTGFYNSFITQQGYKCGTQGWIEAIYQGCSMFITYAKLWEMQNQKQINSSYQKLDEPYKLD